MLGFLPEDAALADVLAFYKWHVVGVVRELLTLKWEACKQVNTVIKFQPRSSLHSQTSRIPITFAAIVASGSLA